MEFIAPEPVEEPPVLGLPSSVGATGGSFRFVQEDELEAEPEPTTWSEQPAEVDIQETITEVTVNGHTIVEDQITITTTQEVRLIVRQKSAED